MAPRMRASFLALRPKQWVKNSLLLVAPFAAGIGFAKEIEVVGLGILAFSLASSVGYIVNDLIDIELDRDHPRKKKRPFASGALTFQSGIMLICLLIALLIPLLIVLDKTFGLIVIAYMVNTFLYSKFLKELPVVEMFAVASGFVLRLVSGAVIIDLTISEWFLIVGAFGALFIVSSKRLSELRLKESQKVRHVINQYSSEFLRAISTISVAISVTAYTFWAFSQSTNPFWFQVSIIPFVISLIRYMWISESAIGEAPEEIILKDKQLQMLAICNLLILFVAIN